MFTSRTRRHARMMIVISLLVAFLFTLSATTPGFTQSAKGELEAPVWTEYRDARYGYGLAVPSDWIIFPTPPEGVRATLVLTNFGDEGRGITSEQWPKGGLKIDITVFENIDKK